MVQMRHFGDDRDYFKHDLISWIIGDKNNEASLRNLVYVPMLTVHRDDNKEGNRKPDTKCNRSEELLDFMAKCSTKSLEHWQRWYTKKVKVANYQTIDPVDKTFFAHETRSEYWKKFKHLIPTENALVFVDPDTGMETGTMGYMKRQGFDKYIFNQELLLDLVKLLHPSSVLMIYQHLSNNADTRPEQVDKRCYQMAGVFHQRFTLAYREDDLAFLFITKTDEIFNKMQVCLHKYNQKSKQADIKKTVRPQVYI